MGVRGDFQWHPGAVRGSRRPTGLQRTVKLPGALARLAAPPARPPLCIALQVAQEWMSSSVSRGRTPLPFAASTGTGPKFLNISGPFTARGRPRTTQ